MDINSILTKDLIKQVAAESGTTQKNVRAVLTEAMPTLAKGIEKKVSTRSGIEELEAASVPTRGGSIGTALLSAVLGSGQTQTTNQVASNTGVSNNLTQTIISAALPLILSNLLGGNQTGTQQDATTSAVQNLLGGSGQSDSSSLLTGLLGSLLSSSGSSNDNSASNSNSNSGNGGGLFGGSGILGVLGSLISTDTSNDNK